MQTAAHELRNLLAVIIGSAEMGQCGRKTPADCFGLIVKSALSCEEVIRDMLLRHAGAVATAEQKQTAAETRPGRPIDLNAIARNAREYLAGLYSAEALQVKLDLQEDLPAVCTGDVGAFARAIFNLCLNSLAAGANRVCIRTRSLGEVAWLSVGDNGSGMAQSKLREIMSPDYRPTEEHGRGVSIVRSTLATMGAELRGETDLGRGSTFTILFKR